MKEFLEKNKGLLLTIASCIGVGATAVATHFSTKKALKKIYLKDLSKKEQLKETWICYAPSVIVGALTVTAIIFNRKLSKDQIAAIASSAGLTSGLLYEYEKKVRDMFGEEKFEEVRKAIAKDHEDGVILAVVPEITSDGFIKTMQDIEPGGDDLFYDEYSKTWFRSNAGAVRMAEYYMNRNLVLGDTVTMGDFYAFLGIPVKDKSLEVIGWGYNFICGGLCWIDFEHTRAVRDDGEEYTIISLVYPPEPVEDEL